MNRRTMLLISVMAGAVLLAMVAGVAWAKTFTCAPGSTYEKPCNGTKKSDNITGTTGRDVIYAKAGKDTVNALDDNDYVKGGGGNDSMDGGPGADFVLGQRGDDLVVGGPGSDALYGHGGVDLLGDIEGPRFGHAEDVDWASGGPGNDTIDVTDGDPLDKICDDEGTNNIFKDDGDQLNPSQCP